MNFAWLKQFMPKGLYGRAALILIVPVVVMQLVLSVVFIQRHYEGVTEQMTSNIVVGLRYLRDEVDATPTPDAAREAVAALLAPLSLRARLPAGAQAPPPAQDRRDAFDLTGRVVIATLRSELDGVRGVDLVTGRNEARLWVETAHGLLFVVLERRRLSASNPHQLLVIVLFTGALMTLIAFFFLRNQVRPIRQLARAAEAFGKGRNIAYRPRGAREVRAAGRAFLEMRDRLERQIESRTRMLSAVSHDLRTPLTRLRLGLALREGDADTAALESDVAEMERLVDTFLAYARDEAVDDPVRRDPVALVRAAVDRAVRSGRDVTLGQVSGAGTEIEMRPGPLARALDNLIANAVNYGDRAEVGIVVRKSDVQITVEDDGPGIAPAWRDEALQPFSRLDSARNQNRSAGVGLGLSIVADAVRGHGGRLRLDDSARLGGLRVVITLPR